MWKLIDYVTLRIQLDRVLFPILFNVFANDLCSVT